MPVDDDQDLHPVMPDPYMVFQRVPREETTEEGRSRSRWQQIAHVWAYDASDAISVVLSDGDRMIRGRWIRPTEEMLCAVRGRCTVDGEKVAEVRIYRARKADTRV